MMRSLRTVRTSSGQISGSGFDSAKITGLGAIAASMTSVTRLGPDRPMKASASCMASAKVRCGDVFEIDAAEGGRDRRHGLDEMLGTIGVDLDVEHIDVGEFLEQHAL